MHYEKDTLLLTIPPWYGFSAEHIGPSKNKQEGSVNLCSSTDWSSVCVATVCVYPVIEQFWVEGSGLGFSVWLVLPTTHPMLQPRDLRGAGGRKGGVPMNFKAQSLQSQVVFCVEALLNPKPHVSGLGFWVWALHGGIKFRRIKFFDHRGNMDGSSAIFGYLVQ